jgi:putative transposase
MRIKPQTYAFTTIAHGRKQLFQRTENANLLISTLLRYRDTGRFLVHGFVVMPDHMHVLLTPSESIEKAAQLIKGGFSYSVRANHSGTVWQVGYHAHRITNADDYYSQREYIANNPIRRGWADYPHVHTSGKWPLDSAPEFPTI